MAIMTWPQSGGGTLQSPVDYPVTFNQAVTVNADLDVNGSIKMTEDTGGTGGATAPSIAAYTNSSWVPVFTQTQGTTITTYSIDNAYWCRIGNLVMFNIHFRITEPVISSAETQKFQFDVPVNSNFSGTGFGCASVSIEPDFGPWVAGNWDTFMRSTSTPNAMLFELYIPAAIAAGALRFAAQGSYEVVD